MNTWTTVFTGARAAAVPLRARSNDVADLSLLSELTNCPTRNLPTTTDLLETRVR